MSIVQHVKVLDSQLANIKIVAGSTIYTRDTGKHFIDISDTERVQISDIIYIDTDKERSALLAPLPDKLYITRDTNKVWIYSVKTDKWVCLNIDTTYTAGTGISINGTTINNSGVRAVTAGASANKINVNTNGNTNTITINNVANATSAGKATNDSAGQQINTTYIKGLSVSGKVITYTKGDGTTGTITTQDTNTWRGIQNVLTSDSTTDSLSAAQGKALKGLVDGKANKATTLSGYGITDANISDGVITLGSNSITPLTSHQSLAAYAKTADMNTALSKKADKATTLSGYGITDAKISDGVITLGANSITPLTNHQSLAAYAKTADVNTALDKKANKATTLSGYGITDAKISNGTITLGSNTITPLTKHQSLDNYYTKGSVDNLISNLKAGLVNVVESLPTAGENGKLYLVKTGSESENLYTEYVYVNKAWEKLGTQKLDLSGYLTKTDAANTYLGKTAAAASANKLNTNAGSATQPIYFANGVPVATTYTLGKSVPSDAKFTDTVYNHPATHPASMITGLATVATSGSYNDLSDKPAAYSLPDATTSVKGGVKIGSNLTISSGTLSLTKANVTNALGYTPPTTNTTYNDMTAATASTAGTHGLVPAPAAGKQLSFLRGDGTWVVPTNTTYPMVSSEVNGIMAASDKVKLDGIAENANNYSHPSSHPASMITGLATVATSGSYNDLTNKPAAYSLPDATASVKGGVKVGSNITVSSGTISLTKANVVAALGYTPPTQDTNTTYSVFKAATASADGGTGLVPAPAKGKQASFLRGDGTWVVPTNTWTAFKGATASAAGTAGYVPAPAAGDQAKFFKADGTWATPTNTTYSAGAGISLSGTTFSNSGVRSVAAGSSANQIAVNTNGTTSTITVNNVANAATADKLTTGRTIALSGAVTGSVTFDGSANKTISTTLSNFDASKITTGTIDLARIPKAAIPELKIVADDTARFALTASDIQNGDTVQVTSTGKMYYVKDQTKLSSEDGYAVYTAGAASSVPWSGVTGKPSSYTPAAHTQAASTITGLATVATSGSYTDLSNKPTIPSKVSQLTNDSGYITGVSWSQVSNKPTSFTPDSHNQASNTITALTGYSKPSSTSAIGTSDSLNSALGKLEKGLDGKLSTSGTAAKASTLAIEAGTADASRYVIFQESANSTSVLSACYDADFKYNPVSNVLTVGSITGNAATATKATQDSAGQQINTTYIKGLSVSGKTITYTKGDGTTGTITTQDTNTTYSTFKGATSSAAGGAGLVPAPAKGAQTKYLRADGTWQTPPDTNTTYSTFKGATSSAAGGAGLVPAPAAGAQAKYLRADGTWQTPPDTNTTYSAATSSNLGLVKIGSNISVSSGTISLTKANVTNALGYTPPTTNTDTHWTTGLKVGASATATANAAATNGNVFLNVLDNTTVRDSHNIVGSGATTVTSDANGKITISSTNTVYTHPTTHPASMITGLATVATSGSYNDLSNKPTIPAAYSLPDATASVKGGVKIGSNLTISSGTISLTKANVTAALGYTPPTTDTNTWRGIQNNLTSDSTTESLSAAQGKALKALVDGKAASNHTHNYAGSSSAGGAATKAIQDGDGKTISSTYAKLSGATFTGDVVMNAPYRDTYYASNLCRHFSQNTPNQFVVKTKIKYVSSAHMPVVRIYGYAYGLESPIELRVGFYIYDNKLGWAGVSCTGAWKPEVYLFSYTENSVKYVAIGFKGSCYFCGFQVDAQIGASGDFNSYFAIDGWRTENNGSNTSTNIIPSAGTNDCIKVDYKPMQTDITGNASTATKATQDSAGQQINTTYIKGLSVSGKTITYTKGNGTTGTITTQDTNTTYSAGTGISLSGTTFSNAGVRSIAAGSSANQLSVNTGGTTATITINNVANATAASTATKATQDSAGQQINTTYIKGLSVSGTTITYTKGDGTTGTIKTQDTNTVYTHPTTHPASMITGLATVATSGSYNDLSNKPTSLPANGGNSTTANGIMPEWSGSLGYGDTDWICAWQSDGKKIKAMNKSVFATSGHTHDYSASTLVAKTFKTSTGIEIY